MRKQVWAIVPFALACIFGAVSLVSCTMTDEEDEIQPSDNIVNVGDELPAFTVLMNDGQSLSSSQLRDKPSLIVFFSTSCPDCQRELPLLNARYLAHGMDTTFVAISREEGWESVSSYWQQQGLSLPVSAQSDRTVYSLFAKKGIPRIYISDAQGIIRSL